jgi:hypothetical protein
MKTCYTCKLSKPFTDFARKTRNKDGFQSECKDCRRVYQQQWYRVNSETHKNKVAKRNGRIVQELRQFVHNYKQNHPCAHCGFNHPAALQFHHHDDNKDMEVAVMVAHRYSKERIIEEINKCTILCANCHAIHHYNERKNKL